MDAEGLKALFEPVGTVAVKRMFGGQGVYADGLCFAIQSQGEVYLKTDAESEKVYADAGSAPFVYVARGKPNPDPFLTAAGRLGVAARDCLALEDSHNGVRAAHAAGMMTVMVPDLLEPTDEMREKCLAIAESLHHVREMIDQGARVAR